MDNIIKSLPNDKVVIIVKAIENSVNNYDLIPVAVKLGRLDEENNSFLSSESELYAPIEKINALGPLYYMGLKDADELLDNYAVEGESISTAMSRYLKDVSNSTFMAVKTTNEVRVIEKKKTIKMFPSNVKQVPYSVPSFLKQQSEPQDLIDIEKLEKYLKDRILFNDEIIEDIVTTIAMNMRAKNKKSVQTIFSVGPSGTGKTETFKLIAEFLDIPVTIFDCTGLTSPGYVGGNVEDILKDIYINSNEDKRVAEKSIVVLDEFDKLAINGHAVKDKIVQQALLKFLEGSKLSTSYEGKAGSKQSLQLDTSFMSIACVGACADLFKKDEKKSSIGFNSSEIVVPSKTIVTQSDLIQYGFIPEIIGRANNIFTYHALTHENIKEILIKSAQSPLRRYIEEYREEFGAEIKLSDDFIDALVEKYISTELGLRGVETILNYAFKKISRELQILDFNGDFGKKQIELSSETLDDNKKYKLI